MSERITINVILTFHSVRSVASTLFELAVLALFLDEFLQLTNGFTW
jgi:hypothetical protein